MEWQSILIDLLSVTSILSIAATIRFWKQNKKLKDNEVKINDSEVASAEIKTQNEQMDLIIKFRDETVKMIDMVKEANAKNFENQDKIITKLNQLESRVERMDTRMEKVEGKVDNMEGFLNGPYHRYVADKETENKEN